MIDIEQEIIVRCKELCRISQMHLYNTFYKRIYNTCYRILRNAEDAEDAMQESFLKTFISLDLYSPDISFEAWIVRIAINTSIDKLRKKDIDKIALNEDIGYNAIIEDDPEDWEDITGKVEKIKRAIEELPDSSRLVLTLYLIEGYDHEEIAEILRIKPGTARVQYLRAKQKLIEFLKGA